jgi:hypothetical protein
MLAKMRDNLIQAQQRMVQLANWKHSERQFNSGDLVYLKLQPYRQKLVAQRTSKKLPSKFYGLNLILKKVGSVASKLLLPTFTSIHLVFHVS